MNYLCVNTCFSSAEIFVGGDKVKFAKIDSNCKHSEQVLPEVENVLNSLNLGVKDVDLLGVCIGPGSFTGIRIGVSLIKGIGFNKDIKVAAFTTFELVATQYFLENTDKDEVVVVIDGLSGYAFVAKLTSNGEYAIEPMLADQQEMLKIIEQNKCEFVCCDQDSLSLKKISITQKAYETIIERKVANKQLISSDLVTPLYLRKSQAEVELEKKENGNK